MTFFKKFQLIKSIIAIFFISILIISCKKELTKTTDASDEQATSANVGLPPTIIGWGRGPDVPITDQQGNPISVVSAFAFAMNGKGYIGGGIAYPFHSHKMYQYDTLTKAWSRVANFPGFNNYISATFVIGDNAYVVTGGDDGSKENWQYNQLKNVWTRKADLPGLSRWGAVGTSVNGKGYVGLGANTDASGWHELNDWWEYDPINDTWFRKADFAGVKRNYPVAFAINNNAYVSTGSHYNQNSHVQEYFNDLWQYNPTADSWTQKADLPASPRYLAVGTTVFPNKGIVATGSSPSSIPSVLNDCWEYIAASNSWVRLPNVGGGPRDSGVAFAIGNILYIATGADVPNPPNDFWGLRINP